MVRTPQSVPEAEVKCFPMVMGVVPSDWVRRSVQRRDLFLRTGLRWVDTVTRS